MEREFDIEALSASPAVFDQPKLDWLGHQHVMLLDDDEHERLVAERLPAGTPPPAAAALAAALKPSISLLRPGAGADRAGARARRLPEALRPALAPAAFADVPLDEFLRLSAAAPDWLSPAAAHELLAAYRAAAAERGLGARRALPPLRLLLTGREHGPELHYVLAAIARDDAVARVRRGLDLLAGTQSRDARRLPRPLSRHSAEGSRDPTLQLHDPAQGGVRPAHAGRRPASTVAGRPCTGWCTSATPVPT